MALPTLTVPGEGDLPWSPSDSASYGGLRCLFCSPTPGGTPSSWRYNHFGTTFPISIPWEEVCPMKKLRTRRQIALRRILAVIAVPAGTGGALRPEKAPLSLPLQRHRRSRAGPGLWPHGGPGPAAGRARPPSSCLGMTRVLLANMVSPAFLARATYCLANPLYCARPDSGCPARDRSRGLPVFTTRTPVRVGGQWAGPGQRHGRRRSLSASPGRKRRNPMEAALQPTGEGGPVLLGPPILTQGRRSVPSYTQITLLECGTARHAPRLTTAPITNP